MRTTVRIDDDLVRELRERAFRERRPFTELVNQAIRSGLGAAADPAAQQSGVYCEEVYSLGEARVGLDKALALAFALDDAETIEQLARRK